jgi:hypothetical protein
MKPHSIGRVLGTGLRVAGRIAGQRIAVSAQAAASRPAPATASAGHPQHENGSVGDRAGRQGAGEAAHGIARGLGGFLRPFGRVGGILWLEVTGVFFFLPVLVFAPFAWRTRLNWAHGPDHRTFLVSVVIVLLFLYLSISSFWRARRR